MSNHTRQVLAATCLWGLVITAAYAFVLAVTILPAMPRG